MLIGFPQLKHLPFCISCWRFSISFHWRHISNFNGRSQPAGAAGEIFVAVFLHHFRQPPDEAALVGG